jgi:JAB domain-containing protein similar to deubiquitination enzymes
MTGFAEVRSVRVPRHCIERMQSHLAAVGRKGLEGMAFWVGTHQNEIFEVRETIIPQQRGTRTAHGLAVTVAGEELHRLNLWLFRNKLRLIAQIHSHPTDAYHSDTDDQYAIATTVGCLSLVVPNFAAKPFHPLDCSVTLL